VSFMHTGSCLHPLSMMVMAENMLGWRMGHLHWALQGIKGTRLAAKWEGTFGLG
jgi:hypothetical protein